MFSSVWILFCACAHRCTTHPGSRPGSSLPNLGSLMTLCPLLVLVTSLSSVLVPSSVPLALFFTLFPSLTSNSRLLYQHHFTDSYLLGSWISGHTKLSCGVVPWGNGIWKMQTWRVAHRESGHGEVGFWICGLSSSVAEWGESSSLEKQWEEENEWRRDVWSFFREGREKSGGLTGQFEKLSSLLCVQVLEVGIQPVWTSTIV